MVKDTIKNNNLAYIVCKGLSVEKEGPNKEIMAKVEMVAQNETGVANVLKLLNALKGKVTFTHFRIMGDNYVNQSNKDIIIGQEGFLALMEAFSKGYFNFTYEFRFYNFKPEITPLLAFADSLINNLTLQTIGFARNRLNEDMCAAILQRLYFNESLKCIDFNGNPITVSMFGDEIVKKYFNSRKNFAIIYD